MNREVRLYGSNGMTVKVYKTTLPLEKVISHAKSIVQRENLMGYDVRSNNTIITSWSR